MPRLPLPFTCVIVIVFFLNFSRIQQCVVPVDVDIHSHSTCITLLLAPPVHNAILLLSVVVVVVVTAVVTL